VAGDLEDELDELVEEADVDHDAEVDDREQQQSRRRRHRGDRIHDHVPDAQTGPGEEAEDGGHEDERQDR
jgi:hypothetical protein